MLATPHSPRSGKLFQETEVVLIEVTDVIDAVHEHREALEAHAEGVPTPDISVVTDGVENRRIDHPTAADFDPFLLHLRKVPCREIDLEARLGVAEIVRAEAGLCLSPEQRGEDVVEQ